MKLFAIFRGGNVSAALRFVTLFVIILGAIVTGAISLILDDLLPKTHPEETFVTSRWTLLIAGVLLIAIAVWMRYEVRTYSGTLFSVQVLDEGIADRTNEGGTETRSAANTRYMYLRSLHRWADYEHATHHGVIQLHELSHEIGATLESLMNTAADDEGTQTVSPNMPWPMALSVGTFLPARQADIRLLDLPKRPGDEQREFPLRSADEVRTAPKIRQRHQLDGVHGNRVGAFLTMTENPDLERFRAFDASTVYTVAVPPGEHRSHYEEFELEALGRIMAEELTAIKEDHPDGELVVAATIPAAVALSIGWNLTQYTVRFYQGTHLLHDDGTRCVPMRVRPSQPALLSTRDDDRVQTPSARLPGE